MHCYYWVTAGFSYLTQYKMLWNKRGVPLIKGSHLDLVSNVEKPVVCVVVSKTQLLSYVSETAQLFTKY